jgi:hypothetical protein
MMLLDPAKTGFARYCPTFSAALGRLRDSVSEKAARRRERERLLGLLKEGMAGRAADAIAEDPCRSALVGGSLFHRERNMRLYACVALRKASEAGADISPAVPLLLRSLSHHDRFMRFEAANALRDALPSLGEGGRRVLESGVDSFVSRRLDQAFFEDPETTLLVARSLLALMRHFAELEGVHPLCIGRLLRELRPDGRENGWADERKA